MAHPLITRRNRLTAVAITGAALVLPATGAAALGVTDVVPVCAEDQVLVEATAECEDILPATDEAGELEAAVEAAVEAAIDGATGELAEILPLDALPAPIGDLLTPEGEPAPAPAPAAPAGSASGNGGSTAGTATTTGGQDGGTVQAAGKAPTEVTEPQAPAADGRVATGPAIQPTDLGVNIPSIRSESGLTLQPYETPMVSVPMEFEAPMVAGAATTAGPIQAAAAEAVSFAGDAFLPYTTGATAWVTAAGLGLLAGTGFVLRRRFDSIENVDLDS